MGTQTVFGWSEGARCWSLQWELRSLAGTSSQELFPMLRPNCKLRVIWEDSLKVFEDDHPYSVSCRATVKYKGRQGCSYGPETCMSSALTCMKNEGLTRTKSARDQGEK